MRYDLIFDSFFVKYQKYLDTRCFNVIYICTVLYKTDIAHESCAIFL